MNRTEKVLAWALVVVGLGTAGTCVGIKSERIHACRAACKAKGFSQEAWMGFEDYDTCKCWNPTWVTLEP